jgi:Skp family chaperone for outer membrane proteins
MTKGKWCFFLAAALLGLGLEANAQTSTVKSSGGASQKIGFISLDTIESQWIEYQLLKSDLDKLFKIDQRDLQNERDGILKREEKLKEQVKQGKMTDEEYQNWHARLLRESQELAIYAKVRSRLVKQKIDKRMERASEIVKQTVEQLGKNQKFDLIVSEDKVMGFDPGLDISSQVIEQLNKTTFNL